MMIDKLIQELDQSDNDARARARQQLTQIGTDAVDALITAMQSGNLRLSWQAAIVLEQIPDPRWLAPMQAAIRSSNILLGQAAVLALENISGMEATEDFLAALPHSRAAVQVTLVNALERLRDSRAIEPLSRLLESTDNSELRYCIIQALGKLGDSSTIPLIEKFQNDPNHHVQERVVIALDRLKRKSQESLPPQYE